MRLLSGEVRIEGDAPQAKKVKGAVVRFDFRRYFGKPLEVTPQAEKLEACKPYLERLAEFKKEHDNGVAPISTD